MTKPVYVIFKKPKFSYPVYEILELTQIPEGAVENRDYVYFIFRSQAESWLDENNPIKIRKRDLKSFILSLPIDMETSEVVNLIEDFVLKKVR